MAWQQERLEHNRLARAQRGDEDAFAQLTEPYRRELQLHCYRIVGSLQDAEDLLQETLLAAWRGLEQFEGRSSLRAWLYTIATNRCLNALRDRERRPQAGARGHDAGHHPSAGELRRDRWLQPYPDSLLEGVIDVAPGPAARYEAKESVALAFVSGLQHLAPRQRAVLVLRDVLGFHADEVADMLGSSEASVNSALQRARGTLEKRLPPAPGAADRAPRRRGRRPGQPLRRRLRARRHRWRRRPAHRGRRGQHAARARVAPGPRRRRALPARPPSAAGGPRLAVRAASPPTSSPRTPSTWRPTASGCARVCSCWACARTASSRSPASTTTACWTVSGRPRTCRAEIK